MVIYRSEQIDLINNSSQLHVVCGVPILPLAAGSCIDGPCTILPDKKYRDIVTESIELFRFLALRRNKFDIHSPADKVLIYLVEWIGKCLKALVEAEEEVVLDRLGVEKFLIKLSKSGDGVVSDGSREQGLYCQYLHQLRLETVRRLVCHIWTDSGLSKWWLQYGRINIVM